MIITGSALEGVGGAHLETNGFLVFVHLDAADRLPATVTPSSQCEAQRAGWRFKGGEGASVDASTVRTSSRASSGTHVSLTKRPADNGNCDHEKEIVSRATRA